jgi:hypothetical protein
LTSLGGGTTAEVVAPADRKKPSTRRATTASGVWRVALAVAWPPVLVAWVYLFIGRLGFYPTDEGLIQGWSYRILLGQVPHRDFVSPLPMGSALLHLVDFAIPGPLFEVSRVIAMVEYTGYAILFAWLIYELAPWHWTVIATLAALGAVLVNLNTFPLIAWYTVDGLLFVAAGYVVVARGVRLRSTRRVAIGFLLLGVAAITKQSFAPATVFGWALLLPWLQEIGWTARVRILLLTGICGAIASLAFVGTISLLGGFHAVRVQLLGTGFVYGRSLVAAWSPRHDLVALGLVVGGAAVLMAIGRLASDMRGGTHRALSLASRVLLTVLVIAVPLYSRLGLDGNEWGIRVFWLAALSVVVHSIAMRRLDLVGTAIVGAAWMSSLSYGYAWPNLVGGSMVLYVLHRTWSGVGWAGVTPSSVGVPALAAAMLGVIGVGYVFGLARQQDVYLDRPAGQLTASLQDVSSAFGDIRTNPQTADYLVQMTDCIRRYPARQVAILPENAAMYPALHLRNPYPIDWMWPDSMHESEARILATTDLLNHEGDYLVLFQTVDEPEVVGGSSLPPAAPDSQISAFTPIPAQIYARLNGQKTTCGSFLVAYSPPTS